MLGCATRADKSWRRPGRKLNKGSRNVSPANRSIGNRRPSTHQNEQSRWRHDRPCGCRGRSAACAPPTVRWCRFPPIDPEDFGRFQSNLLPRPRFAVRMGDSGFRLQRPGRAGIQTCGSGPAESRRPHSGNPRPTRGRVGRNGVVAACRLAPSPSVAAAHAP
jgi:hypothetical protein